MLKPYPFDIWIQILEEAAHGTVTGTWQRLSLAANGGRETVSTLSVTGATALNLANGNVFT